MTRLHIGCGPIYLPGWVNIDNTTADYQIDLRVDCLTLADHFAAGSVDAILSMHHIEHLDYPQDVQAFLKLCHQLLKPLGVLRIGAPDLFLVAREYVNGGNLKDIYGPEFKGYYYHDCPVERLLFFCRAWQHTFIPDWVLMQYLLCDAGFTRIRLCAANQSVIPGYNHDRYQSESLYVEAIK